MSDKWESDTLNSLNDKRKNIGLKSMFKWKGDLEAIARDYATKMNPWSYVSEIPLKIKSNIPSQYQVHYDENVGELGNDIKVSVILDDDKFQYRCYCTYHYANSTSPPYGHPLVRIDSCYRRIKLIDNIPCLFNSKSAGYSIISRCCTHWTAPQQIAELLWMESLADNNIKTGAVAIYNDDLFTYVAFVYK